MSLLLDALKRAEQEKLARQGEASNDAASPRGASNFASPSGKVAAALELQPVATGGPNGAPRAEEAAHAAQVMFEAKTAADDRRGRGMLWATLGAIAVVVASAAAYVWYQIRVLSPAPVPIVTRRAPPPLPQAAASAAPPPAAPIGEPARATPAQPSAPAPATVTVAPPPLLAAAPIAPAPRAEDPVARLLREAPAANAPRPLELQRSVDAPRVPADVGAGYQALRNGDLGEARRRYEAALAAEPLSVDARLGIATVEARAGNRGLANAHYRRALEADPRNPTALAGLAALADGAAPEAVEAQLREDIARFPDSAGLRFALGSHYAAQGRWGEAQAAFYEAHRIDPTAADIAYNLAVSLDHMGQPKLAADFYRRAVEAARVQPAQFDPAPVRRRIAELSAAR